MQCKHANFFYGEILKYIFFISSSFAVLRWIIQFTFAIINNRFLKKIKALQKQNLVDQFFKNAIFFQVRSSKKTQDLKIDRKKNYYTHEWVKTIKAYRN